MRTLYSYTDNYVKKCKDGNLEINEQFIEWVNQIECVIFDKYGAELMDLPDEDYIIEFENGTSVEFMVQLIENDNTDILFNF